jgi:hypothetical protein
MPDISPNRLCSCGSGLASWWENDARGLPLARVCPKCRRERLSVYRPDVLTDSNYWTDEPVEPD